MKKLLVNDMFKHSHSYSKKLLSDFNADFWEEYKNNYIKYDKAFNRLYKNFYYFLQEDCDSIATVYSEFCEDVYNHLLVNSKKYSELYRLYVIDDNKYSLTDNYDVTETMDRDLTNHSSETEGARTDSTNETEGARSDSGTDITGEQTSSNTKKVAPYDSENFYNNEKDDLNNSSRSDSSSFSKGEQHNSSSFSKGSQTNSVNGSNTEDYVLHRKGNIGVMTITDMLDKHNKMWTSYEFYTLIFREIAKELLLV